MAALFTLLAMAFAPGVARAQAQGTSANSGGVPLDVQAAPMRAAYPRPGVYGVAQPSPYPYPYRTRVVPYQGGPIPPGARITTHHSTGLIVGGGVIFLLSYATSIALWNVNRSSALCTSAGTAGCGNSALMAIPLLGPFLALSDGPTWNRVGGVLLIDGVLQLTGLAMGIIGLQISHQMVEYNEPYVPRRFRRQRAQFMVAPSASTTSAGLAVVGTF